MTVKQENKPPSKFGLGLRLKAWWEGYDPDELKKHLEANALDEGDVTLSTSKSTVKKKSDASGAAKGGKEEFDPWSDEAVDVAQYIWGKGFCGPGGPEYVIALSKLLALSPEMSMIQIGAGIGGPARVLADRFGVWLTGYEESQTLVEKGQELSKVAGLDKKAALEHYDPDDCEGFMRKFDRAMAKEALFTIEDKAGIISKVADKLKPGGLFLITEYVIEDDAVITSDEYKTWAVGERRMPCPVTERALKDMLKKAGLQVRVSEDISDQYSKMISQAWTGADKVAARIAEQENGASMVQTLMKEAEFWNRRKKVLGNDTIKLIRIVANKTSSEPGGMSDW